MKILQFTTIFTAFLWVATGLVTVGSIYLSNIGFVINLIVGLSFILIGFYLHLKEKNIFGLLKIVPEDQSRNLYKKVIVGEIIFIAAALFFGLMAFSAVLSRVFGEGFAVFG
ncbi:MAG: hypothetical protein PHE20_01440 [Patescibacteria group bacterium]|nr:hypothetical protein [Patescibacteria group bacterium]